SMKNQVRCSYVRVSLLDGLAPSPSYSAMRRGLSNRCDGVTMVSNQKTILARCLPISLQSFTELGGKKRDEKDFPVDNAIACGARRRLCPESSREPGGRAGA